MTANSEQNISFFRGEFMRKHRFSEASLSLLADKGFEAKDFEQLYEAMLLPSQTFAERRKSASRLEAVLDQGDSPEIAPGRYARYVKDFADISSEQALVQGRMMFAIEYVIELADLLATTNNKLVSASFSDEEKAKLRGIYQNYTTRDFAAVKIIEKKTNHDIVAANTWVTIRAQQEGLDDNLMRTLVHFARTSADVNTNVEGLLYTKAFNRWKTSVNNLLDALQKRAEEYGTLTCVAQTHGQPAQLTTFGFIYANLAEQIRLHLESLPARLDGKIAGAIGTDVDMMTAFPNLEIAPMYMHLVEDTFGLRFIQYGNDQDCTNAALCQALDTMANVGLVMKKAANDIWCYASRGILAKKTKKGESGSSAMPQKANPFLAEGTEALVAMFASEIGAIKDSIVAYRTQGDLRRSITKREAFHPIMLAVIATDRLVEEMNKYEPNIIAIENEIYAQGPKILSSAVQTYLRAQGVPDAYDRIKGVVMTPYVSPVQISVFVMDMAKSGAIDINTAGAVETMLRSVMDVHDYQGQIRNGAEPLHVTMTNMYAYNANADRARLVGSAIGDAQEMAERINRTKTMLAEKLVVPNRV